MNIILKIPEENNLGELKTFLLNYYLEHSESLTGYNKEIGAHIAKILERSKNE